MPKLIISLPKIGSFGTFKFLIEDIILKYIFTLELIGNLAKLYINFDRQHLIKRITKRSVSSLTAVQ